MTNFIEILFKIQNLYSRTCIWIYRLLYGGCLFHGGISKWVMNPVQRWLISENRFIPYSDMHIITQLMAIYCYCLQKKFFDRNEIHNDLLAAQKCAQLSIARNSGTPVTNWLQDSGRGPCFDVFLRCLWNVTTGVVMGVTPERTSNVAMPIMLY